MHCYYRTLITCVCQQPYHVENTGSRPITEVKQHWAWLVLGCHWHFIRGVKLTTHLRLVSR